MNDWFIHKLNDVLFVTGVVTRSIDSMIDLLIEWMTGVLFVTGVVTWSIE